MKQLLISLAFVSGTALACPGDASKEASVPAPVKSAAAEKTAPKAKVAAVKADARPAQESRKVAGL